VGCPVVPGRLNGSDCWANPVNTSRTRTHELRTWKTQRFRLFRSRFVRWESSWRTDSRTQDLKVSTVQIVAPTLRIRIQVEVTEEHGLTNSGPERLKSSDCCANPANTGEYRLTNSDPERLNGWDRCAHPAIQVDRYTNSGPERLNSSNWCAYAG